MTWITMNNVQRAGNSGLQFLYFANHFRDIKLHLHKVSRKNLNSFQVRVDTSTEITIFKVQRAITPKVS